MKTKKWQMRLRDYVKNVDIGTLKRDLKTHRIELRDPNSESQSVLRKIVAASDR